MTPAIIFLDYARHEHTQRTISHNLHNAGHDFAFIYVDRLGIAAAINEGIEKAKAYNADAIVTMANDILMPFDWLKRMVTHAEAIEHTGMCGIHTVEGAGDPVEINGSIVYSVWKCFNTYVSYKPGGRVQYRIRSIRHAGC